MSHAFDYIVVGAGSAGCVLANRLSENGKYTVALIEAGGSDKHFWVNMPLGVGQLLQNPRFAWDYWTNPENALKGQNIYWPRGRVLGGSSSINGMIFVRGEPKRYDEWREAGNEGWGYDDLLPYFKKLEDAPESTGKRRGHGGPVTCSHGTYRDPVSHSFIEAAQGVGIPYNKDYNDERADGVGWLQFSIRKGRRCSTAKAYLHPVMGRPNLTVMTGTPCERVTFDGTRATGVVVGGDGGQRTLSARREVILSAGPIISPKILELSGVGSPDLLGKHGINVLHALPGVGENLVDHLHTRFNYKINKKVTVNDLMSNKLRGAFTLLKYLVKRQGLMAIPSVTAHAMTKSHDAAPYADLKLQIAMYSAKDRYLDSDGGPPTDPFSGIGLGQFHIYPESRGSVHVKSADPAEYPEMNANYFSAQGDAEAAVKGMRKLREIARHPAMAAHIIDEVEPGFDMDSDDEIIDFMKQTGQTSWHPISTCRMGSGQMDVVDARLRVHGLQGLRVIDSSIMPTMPATNTNIPTIAIGEKGADLVLADAG
ncbi:GMC family oxidoreductase N-terminal domain-containing protein [Alisedimentitalea sp. MJ-SS2]|uniref:GMC family oxidoreductase n=1 Tax=Aliisedimentitalea sp. MJ-SS2 TaxID=3049795 RepID=UPI00290F216C|nr:GMC family oxidoreductase N-terminal domain-containing protein [Alisedimentitalea sp. MJ-SS2]MDU8929123.1 GMC family oxidoreductase N-terminal domain-containing protein [Alisedimentitalea sp. MJ-SS2]